MSEHPAGGTGFRFCCPTCGESLAVNEPMRDALVESGCVICGAPVTGDAFSDPSTAADECDAR